LPHFALPLAASYGEIPRAQLPKIKAIRTEIINDLFIDVVNLKGSILNKKPKGS
jgi:hypothetical protein